MENYEKNNELSVIGRWGAPVRGLGVWVISRTGGGGENGGWRFDDIFRRVEGNVAVTIVLVAVAVAVVVVVTVVVGLSYSLPCKFVVVCVCVYVWW